MGLFSFITRLFVRREQYKFVVFKGTDKLWYVRFVAPNGEIMFHTEGYVNKIDAKKAVVSVKSNAPYAQVEEDGKIAYPA